MVRLAGLIALVCLAGCATAPIPVGEPLSDASAADGRYISWHEHMIDGPLISGLPVTGGDGLIMTDIDGDGDLDVYAGGYIRLGRMGWFANPRDAAGAWTRHEVSRRIRGMFDMFVAIDLDADGDTDFVGTRGNANTFDGVFWLEQARGTEPARVFQPARPDDSREMPLPARDRAGG